MDFISRLFSPLFSNSGTDQFTKPINVDNIRYDHLLYGFEVDVKLNEYVTLTNNEYELYRTTPELRTVINKGATLFSNGKWVVKDYKTEEPIKNHPLLKLLEKPNPFQNRNEFLTDVYTNRSLYGNNFTYTNYPIPGISQFPVTLVNLLPKYTTIKRKGRYIVQTDINNIVQSYNLVDPKDKSKIIESFTPDEIIHIKMSNPNDPILGLSPLPSIHMPLSNIRAARGYVNADYTKKGAHGILSSASKDSGGALPLTETDRSDLEKQYSEITHGSYDKQHKVLIANKPVQWNSISSAIKDHVIHDEIQLEFKAIIDAYDLNDSLFSFLRQSTFSNQENGEKQAYQNAIIPFAESFTFALNDNMKLFDKGIYVELDYSHVSALKEDAKQKAETDKLNAETIKILIESGMTLLEARSIVGI